MRSPDELEFFWRTGYLVVEDVLEGDHLKEIRAAFDHVWEVEGGRPSEHQLLKHRPFIDLIEHPPIIERHEAIFGNQVQLIAYDLLSQHPGSDFPERKWHRDFSFPGDQPLAVNTILFVDDIDEERGPTRLLPGTHIGDALPPAQAINEPLEGEVAVPCRAGTAVFINAAIWHSGARNRSASAKRRSIYLYYGYWWLKRYDFERALPWQALDGASDLRLRLLGVKMPGRDLHMYDPDEVAAAVVAA